MKSFFNKSLKILFIFLCSCSNSVSLIDNNKNKYDKKIVLFGDSHSYGSGLLSITWADIVFKTLFNRETQKNYDSDFNLKYFLDNQAMGGSKFDSKHQFLRIMNYDFKKEDIVLMLLGFNDVVYNGTDSLKLELFSSQLKIALDKIEKTGSKVYIGGCIKVPDIVYENMKQNGISVGVDISHGSKEACDLYSNAINEASKDRINVTFIDVNNLIQISMDDLIDGVHFKFSSHEKIANSFLDKIK